MAVTVAFVDLAGQPRPHRPTTRARLVKTIGGDAVMPAADTQMMATLADLADRAAGEDGFLAIRAVIHHGHAVARGGDYFGHAVDIAARITALAGAGRAVIIDDINKAAAARASVKSVRGALMVLAHEASELGEALVVAVPFALRTSRGWVFIMRYTWPASWPWVPPRCRLRGSVSGATTVGGARALV